MALRSSRREDFPHVPSQTRRIGPRPRMAAFQRLIRALASVWWVAQVTQPPRNGTQVVEPSSPRRVPAPGTVFGTAMLAVSSGAFAAATVLDLTDAGGSVRLATIALAVLGFTALVVAAVGSSIMTLRRRAFFRRTAAATLGSEWPRGDTTDHGKEVGRRQSSGALDALAPSSGALPGSGNSQGSGLAWRYAGVHDLQEIADAGKSCVGQDYFYDASELAGYVVAQRDSILCLTGSERGSGLRGYAVVLGLRSVTVERIKAGLIAFGRDILPNDLAHSLDETDAVYIAMLHGFDPRAQMEVSRRVMEHLLRADAKRRPQLILAREGTPDGGLMMRRLACAPFGNAPHIHATFADSEDFHREALRRGSSID